MRYNAYVDLENRVNLKIVSNDEYIQRNLNGDTAFLNLGDFNTNFGVEDLADNVCNAFQEMERYVKEFAAPRPEDELPTEYFNLNPNEFEKIEEIENGIYVINENRGVAIYVPEFENDQNERSIDDGYTAVALGLTEILHTGDKGRLVNAIDEIEYEVVETKKELPFKLVKSKQIIGGYLNLTEMVSDYDFPDNTVYILHLSDRKGPMLQAGSSITFLTSPQAFLLSLPAYGKIMNKINSKDDFDRLRDEFYQNLDSLYELIRD
ncbi:hypothetical protein ACFL1H_05055 [Nanoarchaeota archaeon]